MSKSNNPFGGGSGVGGVFRGSETRIYILYYFAKHFLIIQSDVSKRLQVLGDIFNNALRP